MPDPALHAVDWEDVRKAAFRVLEQTQPLPRNCAPIFRILARVSANRDIDLAIALQERAQQLARTGEGTRTLERLRAKKSGKQPLPVSEADEMSQRREVANLSRATRRRGSLRTA